MIRGSKRSTDPQRSPEEVHVVSKYVSKSTYTRRIEIKVSLLRRGLVKQKCL